MIIWFKRFLQHPIIRDLTKVFTANIFGRVGGFLASIYIIRSMPLAQYGLFSIGFQVMMIVPQIADFGLKDTLIKFGSTTRSSEKKTANTFFKIILLVRAATAMVALLIGILVLPAWLRSTGSIDLLSTIQLGILGGIGLLIYVTIMGIFSAELNFTRVSYHLFTYGYFVIAAVALLTYFEAISSASVLMVYGGIYYFYCIINITYVYRRLRDSREIQREDLKKVVTFSKWLMLSTIVWTFHNQLDVLIVAYLLPLDQVGLYSAAVRIIIPVTVLAQSIGGVLAPRISSTEGRAKFVKWYIAALWLSLALTGISIAILLISPYIIAILGEDYTQLLPVFRVLLFVPPMAALSNLLSWVLLANNKPKIPALVGVLKAVVSIAGVFILVPIMGIMGAAVTQLAVNFIGAVLMMGFAWRLVKGVDIEADVAGESVSNEYL